MPFLRTMEIISAVSKVSSHLGIHTEIFAGSSRSAIAFTLNGGSVTYHPFLSVLPSVRRNPGMIIILLVKPTGFLGKKRREKV